MLQQHLSLPQRQHFQNTSCSLSAPSVGLGEYKNPPSRSCPVLSFQQLCPKPFPSSPVAYDRLCRARLTRFEGGGKKTCSKGYMGIPHLLQRKLTQSQVLQAINSIRAFHSEHTLLHSFRSIHTLYLQVLLQKRLTIRNTEVSNSGVGH